MESAKSEDHQKHLVSSNQHGHLVQQILDSQKEFSQTAGKTEIVSSIILAFVGIYGQCSTNKTFAGMAVWCTKGQRSCKSGS